MGESAVAELHTRPDYAISVRHALAGFIEIEAPGKGGDPRQFKDRHDKAQWEKLQSLPNLIYTDGNEFSLWQNGELVGSVVRLTGDVESSGDKLRMRPPALLASVRGLPPLGADSAAQRKATGPGRRPALPTLARRGHRAIDPGQPRAYVAGDRLAKVALPRRQRQAIRRRLCPGVTFGLLMAGAREIKLGRGSTRLRPNCGRRTR